MSRSNNDRRCIESSEFRVTKRYGPWQGRRAFSLVELLVVLWIIVNLVAILIPTLIRASEQARSVVCQAHLRELFAAHNYYGQENRGRFPHWDWWLWDGKNEERQALFSPSLYDRYGGRRPRKTSEWLKFGQIYPYLREKAVYICPQDSLKRVEAGLSIGARQSEEPIHSYVRLIEPHDFYHQHIGGTASVLDGTLTRADFIGPDDLRSGVFSPPLMADGPRAATGRTGPAGGSRDGNFHPIRRGRPVAARVVLLFEEDETSPRALNDGYSGFYQFDDYLASRHMGDGHFVFWDGHIAIADSHRFRQYPHDDYALQITLGGAVSD